MQIFSVLNSDDAAAPALETQPQGDEEGEQGTGNRVGSREGQSGPGGAVRAWEVMPSHYGYDAIYNPDTQRRHFLLSLTCEYGKTFYMGKIATQEGQGADRLSDGKARFCRMCRGRGGEQTEDHHSA